MSYIRQAGTGTWKTGARWTLAYPRIETPRPGIMWCHGGGGTGATTIETLTSPERSVFFALAEHFPILAVNDVGSNFGAALDQADLVASLAFLHSFPMVKAGPVGAVGVSQGNAAAMNYAQAHPGEIGAIAGSIPLVDPQDVIDHNRGGFAAAVTAVLGNPVNPIYNPNGYAPGNLPPWEAWASPWDDTCYWDTVQAMATKLGSVVHDVGAYGHNPLSTGAINPTEIISFFKAHL